MSQKFSNNARSRLVGALNNAATSFTVESGTADTFPVANTPNWVTPVNWFKATIENSLGQVEIIRVGVRGLGSGVFSNVLRGQDGTTAIAFDAGAVVSLRMTAQDVEAALTVREQNGSFTGNNAFTGNNSHTGQENFTGEIRQNGIQTRTVPVGGIIMYDGLIADIPAGWRLCDGTGGTPDLRDKFVIGSRVDNSGESRTSITGAPTKAGGSKDAIVVGHVHAVNLTSGGMSVDHTHAGTTAAGGNHAHGVTYGSAANTSDVYPSRLSNGSLSNVSTEAAGTHSHTFTTGGASTNHSHGVNGNTENTGSSGTNANLPPYYALAYIKCMAYAP